MKTKTIILSSQNNEESQNSNNKQSRAILSLYEEDDLLKVKMRIYNSKPLDKNTKIGIYHNNQVYTANMIERNGAYTSSFVGDFDLDKDFFTAIINPNLDNAVLLSGGTYSGYFFNDSSVFMDDYDSSQKLSQEEIDTLPTIDTLSDEDYDIESANDTLDTHNNINENTTTFIENESSQPLNSETQNDKQSDTEINHTQSETQETKIDSILSQILPQFEYLFNNYDEDLEIMKLIENSRFISLKENTNEYSIGAIYENEQMKYICYAVKSEYNSPAPADIGEHFQWLPLNPEDPLSNGYYIVFQDTTDLKIVEF